MNKKINDTIESYKKEILEGNSSFCLISKALILSELHPDEELGKIIAKTLMKLENEHSEFLIKYLGRSAYKMNSLKDAIIGLAEKWRDNENLFNFSQKLKKQSV